MMSRDLIAAGRLLDNPTRADRTRVKAKLSTALKCAKSPTMSQVRDTQKFYRWCAVAGACDEGLKWIKGKTYREVWDTLDNPCWLLWLILVIDQERRNAVQEMWTKTTYEEKLIREAKRANGGRSVSIFGVRLDGSDFDHEGYVESQDAMGYPKICNAIRRAAGTRPSLPERKKRR